MASILAILADISYKDWEFRLAPDDSWMQIVFRDPATGEMQHCRKWRLSPHMTRSEVVQTALKAVLSAEEHEAREKFLYLGESIFSPHYDVLDLVQLRRAAVLDTRPEKKPA